MKRHAMQILEYLHEGVPCLCEVKFDHEGHDMPQRRLEFSLQLHAVYCRACKSGAFHCRAKQRAYERMHMQDTQYATVLHSVRCLQANFHGHRRTYCDGAYTEL